MSSDLFDGLQSDVPAIVIGQVWDIAKHHQQVVWGMGGKQQESQEMGKGVHEQIEFAVLVQKLSVACTVPGTVQVPCNLQKTNTVQTRYTKIKKKDHFCNLYIFYL